MYIDPDFPEYWEQGVWVPQHYPESNYVLTIFTNTPYLDEAINHWIKWQLKGEGAKWSGTASGQIPGTVDGVRGLFRCRHRYRFDRQDQALEVLDLFGFSWVAKSTEWYRRVDNEANE